MLPALRPPHLREWAVPEVIRQGIPASAAGLHSPDG